MMVLECPGQFNGWEKINVTKIREIAAKKEGFSRETLKTQKRPSDELNQKQKVPVSELILATGHSARGIFHLLHDRNIEVKAKPFALGVRVEHTQEFIDKLQYHGRLNDEYLPPAAYSLVTQVDGRGVYSFCMCPGGIIAPCATDNGEVVTNGWSPSKRNNPTSNSGIVVSVEPTELPGYSPKNPLISLEFQQKVEQDCWKAAGSTQAVPAQCLKDFVEVPHYGCFTDLRSAAYDDREKCIERIHR